MMRYIVLILSFAFLVGCKSRKIETSVQIAEDINTEQNNGISESRDSICIETSSVADEVNDITTETTTTTYYKDGVIERQEQHTKTTDHSQRKQIQTQKVDEVKAEKTDTTKLIVKNKIRVLEQHKVESKPNNYIFASYLLAIMAIILGVIYKFIHR